MVASDGNCGQGKHITGNGVVVLGENGGGVELPLLSPVIMADAGESHMFGIINFWPLERLILVGKCSMVIGLKPGTPVSSVINFVTSMDIITSFILGADAEENSVLHRTP